MKAARLYAGSIAHIRHAPFIHQFTYRIWMLCADLDRLGELEQSSSLFRHNRFALIALHDADHGFRDGRGLRAYAESALAEAGLQSFGNKILFLAMPRLLGFAFNPIAFYFCYDAAGKLGAILHQVKNTFGGQIGYLMPVTAEPGPIRQSTAKSMHVSPFFDMQGGYRFSLTPPGEKFSVTIQYGTEIPRLTATMHLNAKEFSTANIWHLLFNMPFATVKVVAAINFQALKLFLRGAKFHKCPASPHQSIILGESE